MELTNKHWFRAKLATAAVLMSAAAFAFAVSAGLAPCSSVFAQSTSCSVGDTETFSADVTFNDEINVGATPGPGTAGYLLESQGASASPEWVHFDAVPKTANEIVNASTSLQLDDHFTFPAVANGSYKVDITILYVTSAAADLKFQILTPAGGAVEGVVVYDTSTGGNIDYFTEAAALTVADNTGADNVLHISAIVNLAGTAGDVNFFWAQNSSDATNTTFYIGSTMEVRRVI